MNLSFDFNLYMIPLVITAVITAGLGGIAWQRRHIKGARTFLLMMVVVTINALGYAFELASQDLATAKFIVRIEYFGIGFLGLSYFLHIMAYTGRLEDMPKQLVRLSYVIPIITIVLVWTNDTVIWTSITLDMSRGFTSWRAEHGWWFWVHFVYAYLLTLSSMILLLRSVIQSPTTYRRHLWALLIAALAPFVGNVYLFVVGPAIDPTPFMFAISGLAMAWVMFRGQFLELVPVARERVLLQLRDGVVVLDDNRRILDMNPAAEQILGYGVDEAIGESLPTILPFMHSWEDEPESVAQLEVDIEVAAVARTYTLDITPLQGRRVDGHLVTLHDITPQKQIELALREARDAAQAADAAKTTFLANMSHELRTPLAVILGYTELIEELLTAEQQEVNPLVLDRLSKIHVSGEHLLGIINNVLDLAKVESGRAEVEERLVSLDHLLTAVVTMAKPLMTAKGNTLVTDIMPMGMIETDEVKLKQILMNLLSNAAKFTEQGTVSLTVRRLPTSAQFEIVDTGIGMSETQIERLFQPFMQADASTTRKYGGTGLGLMISKRFAELLGGTIEVRSQLGEGATFVLMLPLPQLEEDDVPIAHTTIAENIVAV